MPLFFLAIAAGFVTIISPCILPVLPLLLGTSGGRSKFRPLAIVVGFVVSFSLIGAALATAGSVLGVSNQALRYAAGILFLLFGLALVFKKAYDRLVAAFQPLLSRLGGAVGGGAATHTDAISGLLVGVSLAILWAPCAGPVLGFILTLAARERDFLTTMLLLFAYALGAGAPMLGIAYGGAAMQRRVKAAGAHATAVNRLLGVIIIAVALATLFGYDAAITAWLTRAFPTTPFNL